jgi:hypothetical protein
MVVFARLALLPYSHALRAPPVLEQPVIALQG